MNVDIELFHRLIGANDYGGKYIPDRAYAHLQNAVCYCFGAGEDISFDVQLARDGHHVFIFDPTPRAQHHFDALTQATAAGQPFSINGNPTSFYDVNTRDLKNITFRPLGLWGRNEVQRFYVPKNTAWVSHSILNLQKTESYFEAPCQTLKTIMKELGHTRVDLLKIDIEGAEYNALEQMLQDGIRPSVINVEYDEGHNPLDDGAQDRIAESVTLLRRAGYQLTYRAAWDFTFLRRSPMARALQMLGLHA
jgi:FkbM family methyltransferase